MRRKLTVAARTAAVGGNITYSIDEFGRQVASYNDLPILISGRDNLNAEILDFSEASSTTSIYIVNLSESAVSGIENGGMMVDDLGLLETEPKYRSRVEWYNGIGVFAPRSAARINLITNVAVTA